MHQTRVCLKQVFHSISHIPKIYKLLKTSIPLQYATVLMHFKLKIRASYKECFEFGILILRGWGKNFVVCY